MSFSAFGVCCFVLDHDYLFVVCLTFLFWCPSVLSCVACPVSYVAVVVAVIVVFFVVSPCLYPCRFACTLFSVPLLGVGVWGVGVVLLGLLGVFWGRASALWVCVPCIVCPVVGSCCLGWGWCVCGRVGVLCCAVVPFLVCMVCGLYVVCCFWYVGVLVLVCRCSCIYDVYCF